MPTQTQSASSAVQSTLTGGVSWSNITNALAEDGSNATAGVGASASGFTHYIKITDFGFTIPEGKNIEEIKVRIKRLGNHQNLGASDNEIKIVKSDGTLGSVNLARTGAYPTTLAFAEYGVGKDKWGESWSPADINSENFGVVISCNLVDATGTTAQVGIDYVEIVVSYADPILSKISEVDILSIGNKDGVLKGNISKRTGVSLRQILQTTYASNNGSAGNMFDVVPLRNITVKTLDVNISGSTVLLRVYTKLGTYVGSETTASDWTLLTTINGITGVLNTITPLNLSLNLEIPSGVRRAFYVDCSSLVIRYTNGVSAGALFASDNNLQIYEGAGKGGGGFSAGTFTPRNWNGRIHYILT